MEDLFETLNRYTQVSFQHSQKDITGNGNVLIAESICDKYKKILGDQYIEMTIGGDSLFSPATVILKNNPHHIHKLQINDYEEYVILSYGDTTEVKFVGCKKERF